MSLWTPDGEHEVPGPGHDGPGEEPQFSAQDEAALQEELARAQAQLLDAPAEEVVANHVMGLYELAAIHLNNAAPAEAQIAIDAMTAVTTSLQGRLGENEPVLREALQQVQVAFVQITNALAEQDGEQPAE